MNETGYNAVEEALQFIEIMGHEVYFETFPNDELELMIADMERN